MDFSETDQQISVLEEAVARITASHSPRAVPGGIRTAVAEATTNLASGIIDARHALAGKESISTLVVVHYTKVETAIHLLENTCHAEKKYAHLRMYSSAAFNDPDEGLYLYRSTIGLEKAESLGLIRPERRSDERAKYAYIASFVTPHNDESPYKAADKLALWRSYGNDGDGVSLVVQIPASALHAVLYGEKEAWETVDIIERYSQRVLESIRKLHNEVVKQEAARVIRERLNLLNYLYKSEAYDYEGESRIVVMPEGDNGTVKQHTEYKNGQFRTYHKHKHLSTSQEDGIFRSGSAIIVGPRVRHRVAAQNHIKRLAQKAGLPTQVRASDIRYRGTDSR